MTDKLGLLLIFALIQVSIGDSSREWVPSSMTAAEMWNPATWYYPHGIAAAESWAEYLKKSQQASNQLYQQWRATGASKGWWHNGQSQYLPPGGGNIGGGGGNNGWQGQGIFGNPGPGRQKQNSTAQTPRPTAQTPRPMWQMPRPTWQMPRPTWQIQQPTWQISQPTGQTPRPTGQYVPI